MISGVKPREKKKFITELQNDQNIVAMVGDGINDAAALASSHVAIAMGGGVGAASEVSSVVLLGNRLSQVPINIILVVHSEYLFHQMVHLLSLKFLHIKNRGADSILHMYMIIIFCFLFISIHIYIYILYLIEYVI